MFHQNHKNYPVPYSKNPRKNRLASLYNDLLFKDLLCDDFLERIFNFLLNPRQNRLASLFFNFYLKKYILEPHI
jgi:hypothetical protein